MKVMAPKNKVESTIHAQGTEISILSSANEEDFISLTDLARYRNSTAPKDVVKNWMRIRSTIEFLGLWEELNNPNFKGVEFDSFKNQAGDNAFTLSPQQWIKQTNAIGILSLGPSKPPWEWLKCSLPGGSFFLFLPFGVYLVFIQNVIKYRA